MNLTTPALLFPAISLLLLAYTNRFLTLAQVIRQLNASPDRGAALVQCQLPGSSAGSPSPSTCKALAC